MMKISFLTASVLASICSVFAADDVPNRTYDKLTYDGQKISGTVQALSDEEKESLAGKQYVLCMIGDSVTWAEDGDYFRSELLKHIPNLAFAGTHTAVLGYSHAGEGGNSTKGVLQRLNDPARVPDADYYHVLIGVNDSSAAKTDSQSDAVAEAAADRIEKIVNTLLKRPCTRKVFLGAILPSPFDMKTRASTVRERTASVLNQKMRQSFHRRFPDGRVVWIEYEEPLRANLAVWNTPQKLRGAHPTKQGYKMVAAIAAPVLKKHMQFNAPAAVGKSGIEVVNLWKNEQNASLPLIPGWYTLSMELDGCS
jgi:lysophospholipase L1-like esterase